MILKHTLNYVAGCIFFVAIAVYLYLLIDDYQTKSVHTRSEQIWIFGYFALLVIGFFVTYYLITKSDARALRMVESYKTTQHVDFIGKSRPMIPIKRATKMISKLF